jgi:hypothetical protein
VSAFRGSVAWTAVAEIAPHSAYCMLRPCLLGTRTIANRRPPGLPEGLMLNSWLIAARTNVELDSNSRFIEVAEDAEHAQSARFRDAQRAGRGRPAAGAR